MPVVQNLSVMDRCIQHGSTIVHQAVCRRGKEGRCAMNQGHHTVSIGSRETTYQQPLDAGLQDEPLQANPDDEDPARGAEQCWED